MSSNYPGMPPSTVRLYAPLSIKHDKHIRPYLSRGQEGKCVTHSTGDVGDGRPVGQKVQYDRHVPMAHVLTGSAAVPAAY